MTLLDLGDEKYISLTTFKRDGTPVSTPVWVAREDGRLLVWSAADTWKVKRIRRDAHVRVAPCSGMGKVRGAPLDGEATIIGDTTTVERLLPRKYWLAYRLIHGWDVVIRRLRRKPDAESVTIAIVPASAPTAGPAV
jgi:PPOX class probable F420-dependent enzyme